MSKPAPESGPDAISKDLEPDKAEVVKTFGDLRVEVQSLKIINGTDYLLSLNVTNLSLEKTLYISLECEGPIPGALKSTVTDPEGYQFISYHKHPVISSTASTGWVNR